MKAKNNNTSMFLYTALIFIVAIILIIISFFGQANVERSQPQIKETVAPSEHLSNSISERAAVLSEENRVLLDENIKLKDENKNSGYLITAVNYMLVDDKENAKIFLGKLEADKLSDEQKTLYDKVNQFINQ